MTRHSPTDKRMDAALLSRLIALIGKYEPEQRLIPFAARTRESVNEQVKFLLLGVSLSVVFTRRPSLQEASIEGTVKNVYGQVDTPQTRAVHRARRLLTTLLVRGVLKRGEV